MIKLLCLLLCPALLVAPVVFAGNTNPPTTPTNEVEIQRATWHDAKRGRDLPVKIYSPKSGNGPFPVIIFSHGLGGSREGYEYLSEHWAARGYVCVHLQHTGSDTTVWRDAINEGRNAAMRKAVGDIRNSVNRPQDVSFAIDELERLNVGKSRWHGRLDLNRIGVAGHSYGAFTALAVAGQVFAPGTVLEDHLADPRVKAAIAMSAPVPANRRRLDESYAKVTIPCFHMTGTLDESPLGETHAAERRLPFDHCNNSNQFLVIFNGGDHMIFSGRGPLTSGQDKQFQDFIRDGATAFWDSYLRGDTKAKAWLTKDFKSALGDTGTFEMKLKK